MPSRAGIPLVDFFDLLDRAVALLPQDIEDFLEQFVVVEYETSLAPGAVFHHGKLQPLDATISEIPTAFDLGISTLSLPLLQTGIPFTLAFQRAAIVNNLEPDASAWRLDLKLDAFKLVLAGLEPAIFVPDASTAPRHLLRDPNRENVVITGTAVLRLQQTSPGANVDVAFVDQSDPLSPLAFSGAVASVVCSPPHFFIGGSEFGLSVGKLTFDFSDSYSPPDVIARNQDAAWVGLAIQEATFYAPRNLPGLGDLSGGVKNVLIGSPVGLQGELEIQFGRSPMAPETLVFEQVTAGGTQALTISVDQGSACSIEIQAPQGSDVVILAGLASVAPPADPTLPSTALVDWTARWNWPDGTTETADSSRGVVRHGQTLRVTPVEIVSIDGTESEFAHPEITYRFVPAGTGPRIDAAIGTERFLNVVHLGGTSAAIEGVTLTAVSAAGSPGSFAWQIEGQPARRTGASYTPMLGDLSGAQTILLSETIPAAPGADDIRLTRLRLEIRDAGTLLVGCETGVFDAGDDSQALDLAAVEDTFDLSDFHAEGQLNAKMEQATLDASLPAGVDVPGDGLARVTIAAASAPPVALDRHVQILMDFDTDNELRWGEAKPAGAPGSGAFSQSDLLAWAARYPGAEFVVVGRCDDLGAAGYNATLATDRATRARTLLSALQSGQTGTAVDAARIFMRGEQSAFAGADANGDDLEENADIALDAAEKSEATTDASLASGWLIRSEHAEHTGWPDERDVGDPSEATRESYRRVDVYAVGGTPSGDSVLTDDDSVLGSALRRSFVPADDRATAAVPAGSPAIDYRVKLRIVWDSPTVSEMKDAIPTLAEAEFAWTPQQAPLPAIDAQQVQLSREVLTVFVNWTHDARTGYTKASLGIKSEGDPDGLISSTTKPLIAALAFGPALLSGVDADDDLIGSGARIAALLAAVSVSETNLGGDSTFIASGSKVALLSAAFETEMRSIADPGPDMQVRVVTDYVCTLHIDSGVLGVKTMPDSPLKIRYRGVGIEYDTSKADWERFGLVYDSASLEIEDPGRWRVDGELGELLRIVEVAVGQGSVWFEARIAVAIEIGILEITEAVIRLTFTNGSLIPAFELRGLVVKTNVPGVLEGEGRVRIEDPGGVVRAGISASIVPLGLGAEAAIAFGRPPEIAPSVFVSLYLGVQFATPLPLANSGLAIYGFKGMFTMNGARAPVSNPDPVGSELAWWNLSPSEKYDPAKDQFALGVGAVVGTLPDVSFMVSCSGMIVVAFPDVEVILGVDVNMVQVPDTVAKDQRGTTSTITGLIVIDDTAVKLAASGSYIVPSVLELNVPFAGYFPYPETGEEVYVRLGSDGQTQHGRFGEPITLTLLPDTITARAWAYLMIEQGGITALGGDTDFNFDGFAVGFGAGWEIAWSAGPIELRASAKVLVGFGTAPLMIKGGVFVDGELDLVVVSIAAHGSLVLEAREFLDNGTRQVAVKIEGEFCGEVDLLFFDLSGCVGVSIDLQPDLIPPAPPSPVSRVSLTDRRDRIMGVATKADPAGAAIFVATPGSGASPEQNNVVWPDTSPLIQFRHYIANGLDPLSQFQPGETPTAPEWFGSSELKYAYRLTRLELREHVTQDEVEGLTPTARLQSSWTTSPYRQPDASGVDNPIPSEHEGPNLKLLDWNPWSWVVNMDNGGDGQDGDPVDTIEDICDPKPVPHRACVFGRAARRAGHHRVRMRQETPAPPPYPSRFFVTGEPAIRSGANRLVGKPLQTFLAQTGGQILPGAVMALSIAAEVSGERLRDGYRLPTLRRLRARGYRDLPLPWEGAFDQRVADPSVLLLVCDAPTQAPEDDVEASPCDAFANVKPAGTLSELRRPGMTLRAIERGRDVTLVDNVDQSVDPATAGSDGSGEVRIPGSKGLEIRFTAPCDQVELHVMLFSPVKVSAIALDAGGGLVARAETTTAERTAQLLTLAGTAITRVVLEGGVGEAVLFKVCTRRETKPQLDEVCETFMKLKPNAASVRSVTHAGYVFDVIDRAARLRVLDGVDQSTTPPRAGRDGGGEIHFPRSGVRIRLPKPCPAIDVHVMLGLDELVSGEAFDAAGKPVAQARSTVGTATPQVLRFRSPDQTPIASIVLKGRADMAAIFRICCAHREAERICVDFAGFKPPRDPVPRFEHRALRFETISGTVDFAFTDAVNARPEPDRIGTDRVMELRFASTGMRIVMPAPCTAVELKVMLFSGPAVRAVARDGLGTRVAQAETGTDQRVPYVLRLDGIDIRTVEITGGSGEARLYEICREEMAASPGEQPQEPKRAIGHAVIETLATAAASDDVVVTGIVGDALRDRWLARVVEERSYGDRGRCRLIAFTPRDARGGPWDGFQILSPNGVETTLVAVCGIDQRAIAARANDAAVQSQLVRTIGAATLAEPDERREMLLESDTEYDIVIGWSWQAWQPTSSGQTPPSTSSGTWIDGDVEVFRFRTAADQSLLGEPQDGLNEYVFDARDVDRYVLGVEPADARGTHFTDDPVWVHFEAGHVAHLLEIYGRTLTIEIKRTDPPPQSPPVTTSGMIAVTQEWFDLAVDRAPVGYQRLNAAIRAVPCLPDGAPFGGGSLAVNADLEPDASYDLALLAPVGINRPVLRATRFHTSRYASPRAFLDALGYTPTVAPYLPDDHILPDGVVMPGGALVEGDAALDTLLMQIGAETLPLPQRKSRSHAIWRFDAVAGWSLEALLVDALEPMHREQTIVTNTGQPDTGIRMALTHAVVGSTRFELLRVNTAWTRAVLKPATPPPLIAGTDATLSLHFDTSTGAISGSRRLRAVPGLVEREGL